MVKRFHPDSGSPEANEEKFHLVCSSLISKKKLKEKKIPTYFMHSILTYGSPFAPW
jgi:hypothetical protein